MTTTPDQGRSKPTHADRVRPDGYGADGYGADGYGAGRLGESPWDSQHHEYDYAVTAISGTIPEALRGVLYRIGPGRLDVGGHPLHHIIDGDGMVTCLDIGADGVHVRNRYVRTRAYARSAETSTPPRGFGTQRLGGVWANALRFPENMSNTNVLVHNEALYTLWEGGRPHRLHPETLEPVGPESFGGALKRIGAFSAHPKTDPVTGDVYNFGLDFYPQPMIRCYRLDRNARLHPAGGFPIPKLGFVHDFALTARYLVFVLGPLVVTRPIPVALGLRPFDDALEYRPDLCTTTVLVPRAGGTPIRIDHDPLFYFHVTNAYETDDQVVVELVAHDPGHGWAEWNGHLHDFRTDSGPAFGGTLTRLAITPASRTATTEPLHDAGCEFPQLDQRCTTRRHRFTYLAEASAPGGDPDSITTIDHRTGARDTFRAEGANTICEPLFAADPGADAEGKGWLLTLEHQPQQRSSRMIVLDAEHPGAGPIAAATLDHHVPMTFHGTFVPAG
ncbi:carotenoid oxygenase family protein [Gordonia desulfuricans]|uniref:Dioxygenase n=1 Tax=Gordonia desulfuricans TaxID=89051 RepID=A0A7K3LQU6_9ACTN|nr:carotenoid oxygenase family protein [Gordonia desulfuricans]NDK90570.1 carotenoid oxygenase family protein [Gordonia desulfuricans]